MEACACLYTNDCNAYVPTEDPLHMSSHIIKTAQRLEELNSWISHGIRALGLFYYVKAWYQPFNDTQLSEGISVCYYTSVILMTLILRLRIYCHTSKSHEILELRRNGYIFFQRC